MIHFSKNFLKHLVKNKSMKKKQLTIRERVISFTKEFSIKDDVKVKAIASMMELIERAKNPNMFCDKCDARMSLDLEAKQLECFSCGDKKYIYEQETYEKKDVEKDVEEVVINEQEKHNPLKPKTKVVAKKTEGGNQIIKALDKYEEDEKKKSKKKSILDIANSRGGGTKPNQEDEDQIKRNVPGAGNGINWCQ